MPPLTVQRQAQGFACAGIWRQEDRKTLIQPGVRLNEEQEGRGGPEHNGEVTLE